MDFFNEGLTPAMAEVLAAVEIVEKYVECAQAKEEISEELFSTLQILNDSCSCFCEAFADYARERR